jgi:hypothetical protein
MAVPPSAKARRRLGDRVGSREGAQTGLLSVVHLTAPARLVSFVAGPGAADLRVVRSAGLRAAVAFRSGRRLRSRCAPLRRHTQPLRRGARLFEFVGSDALRQAAEAETIDRSEPTPHGQDDV